MKKNLILVALATMMVCSCSTVKKTASTTDVKTLIQSSTTAELEISQRRASLEFHPKGRERRGGFDNIINCATQELLRNNGDADVLVHPEYTWRRKYGLFCWYGKIKEVTVTGYPAKYKNFKSN